MINLSMMLILGFLFIGTLLLIYIAINWVENALQQEKQKIHTLENKTNQTKPNEK